MLEEINNFKLIRKIGSGSFGEVFLAEDKLNGLQVAVKKEPKYTQTPLLRFESSVLKYLQGGPGIPRYRWHGNHGNFDVLIMDLLGPSIEQLFVFCGRKFSIKTLLMITIQLMDILKYIHCKNIIHRDIKPDNILFGLGTKKNVIYLIDYGLGKKFRDSRTNSHIPFKTGKSLLGTARYCSINTHLNYEQSRRDDLESIAYVLIYFMRGTLPWQNINALKSEKYRLIGEKKKSILEEDLCKGMPTEFALFLKAVKALKFEESPNYKEYSRMFKDLFARLNYVNDNEFDWTIINEKKRKI